MVVGVITLLSCLLLPALNSAKRKAKRINCVANLHQIGVALGIYEIDDHYYPMATAGDGLGNWQRALRPAAGNDVFHCPQLASASDQFLQFFPSNTFIFPHYGYNSFGAVQRNPPPQNLGLGGNFVWDDSGGGSYMPEHETLVCHPDQMVAVGDSPTFVRPPNSSLSTITPDDPIYISYPFILQPTGYYGVGNWHDDDANMVFCDGHTEFKKQSIWMAADASSKQLWNCDNLSHPECW